MGGGEEKEEERNKIMLYVGKMWDFLVDCTESISGPFKKLVISLYMQLDLFNRRMVDFANSFAVRIGTVAMQKLAVVITLISKPPTLANSIVHFCRLLLRYCLNIIQLSWSQ